MKENSRHFAPKSERTLLPSPFPFDFPFPFSFHSSQRNLAICSGVATEGKRGQLPPPTLSRIDPEISTNPMRNNHNWCMGVATSKIDLDSDGYFYVCKKNQNHCNQNVFWCQNMAKMLWRPGLCPGPRWGTCSAPPYP